MSFFAELKRRHVFKVGAAYLVVGWLMIEVASTIAPHLSLPEWAPRLITFIVIIGFPLALVLAWIFDMTPEGVQVTQGGTGNKRFYATVAVIAAALLAWFFIKAPDDAAVPAVATAAAPAAEAVANTLPPSIAVLPFTDLSPGNDQGYFADGIAEEILNLLARNPAMRVVARTSAFQFREAADLREVGTALNASRILEGSVRTAGTRVRITAQLIDTESGLHLWSETYDRELTDIFQVQDEIAGAIAQELGVRLGAPRAPTAAAPDTAAYHVYLRGLRALNERNTPGRLQEAIDLFTQATEMDPTFASAHGSLALAYAVAQFFDLLDQAESLSLTVAASDAAFALDPDNVEALLARGFVAAMVELRIADGEAMLRRVLELRPNDITAINFLGDVALLTGNRDAAFEFESRAADLDPLQSIHQLELGFVNIADRNWNRALEHARRAEALDPNNLRSPAVEVQALVFRGELAAAEARFESAVAAGRYVWGQRLDACLLDLASGEAARVAACAQRADEGHQRGEMPAAGRAAVHYLAGEYAEAAALLRGELSSGNSFWIAGTYSMDMYLTLVREGYELPVPAKFEELFAHWESSVWANLPPVPEVLAEVYGR